MRRTVVPDLLLDAYGARGGVGITVEDGLVVGVGPANGSTERSAEGGERLPGRALAPAFVNSHSHAFQRNLRGRVEYANPERPRDDFWTWREQMYSLAEGLDPASIRKASEECYGELLSAGYASVAEFHYVHHRPNGAPYGDPNSLAKAVVEAAESTGIRLTLLPVAYARGGVPRFRDEDVEVFLGRVESLRRWAEGRPLVDVGIAAHSVRAVPLGWLQRPAPPCTRRRADPRG